MDHGTGNLQLGLRLRERGLDAVEESNLSWVDRMRRQARKICMVNGEVTTDELRAFADAEGLQPEHHNAWGAIFRGPQWRCVDRRKSERPSAHGREIRVWSFSPQQP